MAVALFAAGCSSSDDNTSTSGSGSNGQSSATAGNGSGSNGGNSSSTGNANAGNNGGSSGNASAGNNGGSSGSASAGNNGGSSGNASAGNNGGGSASAGNGGDNSGGNGSATAGNNGGGSASAGNGGDNSGGTAGTNSGGTAGNGGTTGGDCGNVTPQGDCNGSNVEYCYPGDLDDGGTGVVTYDCNDYVQNDPDFSCGTVDADYGVDCLAAVGSECVFEDDQGNEVLSFCATGGGCDLISGNCVATAPATCTVDPNTGDGNEPFCTGNTLVLACQSTQPGFVDCTQIDPNGTCSNGACVNLGSGAPCDGEVFNCASGLSCTDLPDGGGSVCQ